MTVHYLSTPLYRPNGIVEYIRAYTELFGGTLYTNGIPKVQSVHIAEYLDPCRHIDYEPISSTCRFTGDIVPNLQWPEDLVSAFTEAAGTLPSHCQIFTHCAVSALGVYRSGRRQVFVQHESDIYYPKLRLSYMSDEWLKRHRDLMKVVTIGATMPPTKYMEYGAAAHTPYPVVFRQIEQTEHEGEIIAFFDTSYRKGWDRYFKWWEVNGKPRTTVISHSSRSEWPKEWKVRSVAPNGAPEAKLQTIRNHAMAFIPSRSEVTCLALVECLSQIPVYTFDDAWTEPYASRVTRIPAAWFEPETPYKSTA